MNDTNEAPWDIRAADFPALGTVNEKLLFLLRYAVLAPSSHNSQPWRFGLGDGYVELHADTSRALPVVDPVDRELVMSCGAALFHLRLAALRFGYTPKIALFPHGTQGDHLATLELGAADATSHEERVLCDAVLTRRTSRHAFAAVALPDDLLDGLERAVTAEGAWLRFIVGEPRAHLADLVAEADRVQHDDPGFRAELARWLRPNHSAHADGMPGYALGQGELASIVGPLLVRSFDRGDGRAAADRELVDWTSMVVIIGTERDDRPAWLAAGQAMARMLLRATAGGVSASFLNQAIEVPAVRARLGQDFGLRGAPQLIVRLGYGPERVRATPRRAVAATLMP